jgi:disulfide oxidoreductase YuzD
MADKTEKADKEAIHWLDAPEDKDYPAAESYLGLLWPEDKARAVSESLKTAPGARFKAKDIFRASQLSLLGVSNSHVQKDRDKISAGKALSPLLLVRAPEWGRVVVADGYHRLCAVYSVSEDEWIPCRIV